MRYPDDDFDTLSWQAGRLIEEGRYADASTLYERALRVPGISEEQRWRATNWLAECLQMQGRHPEALARYVEVYVATRDLPPYHEQACRAFFAQVHTLKMIHWSQNANTPENLNHLLTVIAEGIRWLEDIGQEGWRHALLYEKAWALYSLNQGQEALDVAEEALRLYQRHGGSGYATGTYAYLVARFAREQGQPERALRALDAAEDAADNTALTRVQMQQERVESLLSFTPPRAGEALDTARRLVRLAEAVQHNQERVKAYGALVMAAVAARSYAEAEEAAQTARDTAFNDDTFGRPILLQAARFRLWRSLSLLEGATEAEAVALRAQLIAWEQEMAQLLQDTEEA